MAAMEISYIFSIIFLIAIKEKLLRIEFFPELKQNLAYEKDLCQFLIVFSLCKPTALYRSSRCENFLDDTFTLLCVHNLFTSCEELKKDSE